MVPEVDEDLSWPRAPDVLSVSLYLPVDDPLDGESRRVQKDGTYGTHGFGAEAAGRPLTQLMRVIGEEKILSVEVDECGFEVEGGALSRVVGDETEGVDGECL